MSFDQIHKLFSEIKKAANELGPVKTSIASLLASMGIVLQFVKRIVQRRDNKILNVLKESRRSALVKKAPGQHIAVLPTPLSAIVDEVGRSEKSVYKSLRRLENRGEVYETRDGWNLGKRPKAIAPFEVGTSRWGKSWVNDW
jgi:hypothetical protein